MKARVVIVDDESVFAQVLAERLSMRGYETGYCLSGRQALKTIRQEPIDVVILDVVMPHMDGIAALRAIKESSPLVEVILLSGKTTLQTAIEGMRRGAFEYLTKPCHTETMTAKIDAAFYRKCDQEARIATALAEIESVEEKQTEAPST
jgi:DNA-binding NtrC family response regulator